jgi:hypothetical protein
MSDYVTALSPEHVRRVCRIGQADKCCIFLIAGPGGFECGKGTSAQDVLLARRPTMVAQGDNCDGPPTFGEVPS